MGGEQGIGSGARAVLHGFLEEGGAYVGRSGPLRDTGATTFLLSLCARRTAGTRGTGARSSPQTRYKRARLQVYPSGGCGFPIGWFVRSHGSTAPVRSSDTTSARA